MQEKYMEKGLNNFLLNLLNLRKLWYNICSRIKKEGIL